MSVLKKIFVPAYAKEDIKDIGYLLYSQGLVPVFYEEEHPYSDEIDGMQINVHTAGIFSCACESAIKYNAIAVPSMFMGNADINELISYCLVKRVTVFVFDKLGNCLRPGLWDPNYTPRFEETALLPKEKPKPHADECSIEDTEVKTYQTVTANEQADKI
jgi:hypothetical protein